MTDDPRAQHIRELVYDPLTEPDLARRVRLRHITQCALWQTVMTVYREVATPMNPRGDLVGKADALVDEIRLLADVHAALLAVVPPPPQEPDQRTHIHRSADEVARCSVCSQQTTGKRKYQCHRCGIDFNSEPFLGTVTERGIAWHPHFCSSNCRVQWAAQKSRETTPPQPSLTPADLIALRDEMRQYAHRKHNAFSGRNVAAIWADQLDTLITRDGRGEETLTRVDGPI